MSNERDAMSHIVLFVVTLLVSLRTGYPETPSEESRRGVPSVPTGMVEVVLDTDAFNEIDDQFALAFAAHSPHKIKLLAVTAAPFRNQRSNSFADGMEKSYQEIIRILKLLELPPEIAVRGSQHKLPDSETPIESAAARKIIELAKQERQGPLYVVGLGTATNIASAILLDPTIKDRIVVVWIGGHPYHFDNALDFNLKQDVKAAQVLFATDVPLVHIPAGDVAEKLAVTLPELADGIRGESILCDELYDRVASYRKEVTKETDGDRGEKTWTKIIWDIATIAWLVDPEHSVETEVRARPRLQADGTWSRRNESSNNHVRVAVDLDRSLVFQHLFASLTDAVPTACHNIHAETPAKLRELFRYTGDRLPIVCAHRGGAGPGLPENCIPTFAETLNHGYAMLEIDPRVTRDGQIVVHHDRALDRTTTGHGPIKERTLAELKELRLKDINGDVTSYQIPTLSEVFEWARGRAILVIDSKDLSIAERVRQIENHNAESYAMLIAGRVKDAKECHKLNPDIMMEVFIADRERFEAFEESGVRWSNVIAFVGHEPTNDRELLRLLHERGVSTIAGTSRNLDRELAKRPEGDGDLESKYRELLERGIDLIETDLPRRIWPLLYRDVDIPASRNAFFNRRMEPGQ